MKKNFRTVVLSLLSLLFLFVSLSAAFADAAPAPVNFGQDANKMQWYLVNYGKDDEGCFACTRKYYTNPDIKKETVGLIVEKFNVDEGTAGDLYFTEYGYIYSPDGKEFALTYVSHYDMLGNVIKSTEYDSSSREYVKMSKEMIPFKAHPYASGKVNVKKK